MLTLLQIVLFMEMNPWSQYAPMLAVVLSLQGQNGRSVQTMNRAWAEERPTVLQPVLARWPKRGWGQQGGWGEPGVGLGASQCCR